MFCRRLVTFNMANYLFFTILVCFIICLGKTNQVLGDDADAPQDAGNPDQPEVLPNDVEIDPNTNLTVDWTPSEDINTKNETLDELLNDLATIEAELRNDPINNAENLTRDLVEECKRLNISLTVLNPTSPEFNPETDWDIVDILTTGIRVMACDRMQWKEKPCPPFTEQMQCLYQPMKLLPGYGGLGCWTQCDVIPCWEVGADELAEEQTEEFIQNQTDSDPRERLENTQAINNALMELIKNKASLTDVESVAEETGQEEAAGQEAVVEQGTGEQTGEGTETVSVGESGKTNEEQPAVQQPSVEGSP